MNRVYTALLILFLGFLLVRPFISPSRPISGWAVCNDSIAKLCVGVQSGEGRIARCLLDKAHVAQIPLACKQIAEKGLGQAPNWNSCTASIAKFCPGVKSGDGRVAACLVEKEHIGSIPLSCRAAAENAVAINANPSWSVCDPFVSRLCSGVAAGAGRVLQCLLEKNHISSLTPACRRAAEIRLAGNQRGAPKTRQ